MKQALYLTFLCTGVWEFKSMIREFANKVSDHLHKITGVEQRLTSAYHPQSNGICKWQNWTVKDSLVKIFEEKPNQCPYITNSVLFAHRFSRHNAIIGIPISPIGIRYEFLEMQVVDDYLYD